jgi:hypothetical protein
MTMSQLVQICAPQTTWAALTLGVARQRVAKIAKSAAKSMRTRGCLPSRPELLLHLHLLAFKVQARRSPQRTQSHMGLLAYGSSALIRPTPKRVQAQCNRRAEMKSRDVAEIVTVWLLGVVTIDQPTTASDQRGCSVGRLDVLCNWRRCPPMSRARN